MFQFQDENEGPVTKSIRLTASLILRNLVNYTTTAKRYVILLIQHLLFIFLFFVSFITHGIDTFARDQVTQ